MYVFIWQKDSLLICYWRNTYLLLTLCMVHVESLLRSYKLSTFLYWLMYILDHNILSNCLHEWRLRSPSAYLFPIFLSPYYSISFPNGFDLLIYIVWRFVIMSLDWIQVLRITVWNCTIPASHHSLFLLKATFLTHYLPDKYLKSPFIYKFRANLKSLIHFCTVSVYNSHLWQFHIHFIPTLIIKSRSKCRII